jgi:hypothetical protein
MTTLVTMRRTTRKKDVLGRKHHLGQIAYTGRAVTWDDRVMVMNRDGNVLFSGSRRLWTLLVSLGLAAGGPGPMQREPLPAQR